jgi:TP901 family phage tail tape measure protein
MNLDAILRIGAKVTGTEQLTGLQQRFNGLQSAAKNLTTQGGLLGGALGALAPVATISGLGALVTKTIAAGDEMNDLAQRTGVSVEALAKFKKAAATSGTNLDNVAKSLSKLSKGLYETAQTGKGSTAEALKTLGISATDAAGKLKSADQVTLEIANKFKTMPDGVQKTALAMQLFGKSGAEMIPMLNMGGDAIDRLKVKMTAAFAEKADEYNDKLATLSGKVGGLAAGLTVALLPALDLMVTGVTALVDAFTKLPDWMQSVIGLVAVLAIGFTALGPIIAGVITVLTTAGTLVAGIAGWPILIGAALVAIGTLVWNFRDEIGNALTAIGKAVWGALDGINKGIRDGLLALFRTVWNTADSINKAIVNGIGAAWEWLKNSYQAADRQLDSLINSTGKLGQSFAPLIVILSTAAMAVAGVTGWPILIGAALVAIGMLVWNFRDEIGSALKAIGEAVWGALDGINTGIRSGITAAWEWLQERFGDLTGWLSDLAKGFGEILGKGFEIMHKAIRSAIGAAWEWLQDRFDTLSGWLKGLVDGAGKLLGSLGDAIKAPFIQAVGAIRGVLNSIINAIVGAVNGVLSQINRAISAANQLASTLRLPQLPTLPLLSAPSFEGGGYTGDGPRVGGVDGRGGFPAILHPRETVIDHTMPGAGGGSLQLTIQTGPVLQQADGSQWVRREDLQRAMEATAAAVYGSLRSPSGRVVMGGAR